MKTLSKVRGATLLEVMLVLAIAAMIIVMSVRYYQTATGNQQANAVISQATAISAAFDQLAQASGSYMDVTSANVDAILPKNGMVTPWGTTMAATPVTTSTYTLLVPATPAGVCPLMTTKIIANNHYKLTSGTCGNAQSDISFTYTANP